LFFCDLALSFSVLSSCATVLSSRKYLDTSLDSKSSARTEEFFPRLWEKWTVQFGAVTGGGAPLQLLNPLNMIGGVTPDGGENQFPLLIDATLMDTLLIEAGLQHYSSLIAVTPEEEREFRTSYFQRYDVGNHLLIWCEIQTFWSELYLDPSRWIIFIEDDAGNQYEPIQILEGENKAPAFSQKVKDRFPELQPEDRKPEWETHKKSLMLCFPKRDFLNNPVLSKRVKSLKLIFQQIGTKKARAEGTWIFKE
jgi:hypothetical protein